MKSDLAGKSNWFTAGGGVGIVAVGGGINSSGKSAFTEKQNNGSPGGDFGVGVGAGFGYLVGECKTSILGCNK